MKIIIVDDEQSSINNLKSIIKKYCNSISEISEATNISIAEDLIRKNTFDILFLDIEMPLGNGFELIQNISDLQFNIIFVTAFDSYAVEAFRKNAIDYLLKPIDIDHLLEAVEKVKKQQLNINNKSNAIIEKFPNLFNTNNKLKLPTMSGFELINTEEIMFVKSSGNYSHLYSKHDKKYILSKNIGEIEKLLTVPNFLRIHNEHIVNVNEIIRYVKGRGGYVILKNNQHLEVAFRRKKYLLDILES